MTKSSQTKGLFLHTEVYSGNSANVVDDDDDNVGSDDLDGCCFGVGEDDDDHKTNLNKYNRVLLKLIVSTLNNKICSYYLNQ